MADEDKDDPAAVAEAKRLLNAWPVTVTLSAPITFNKETIDELVFPKGTFGVLKGLNIAIDRMPTIDELMMIASRLCGRPITVIERLDPDDASEVATVAILFFSRCRGAGKRI